jgi:hypothetical protein
MRKGKRNQRVKAKEKREEIENNSRKGRRKEIKRTRSRQGENGREEEERECVMGNGRPVKS